VIVTHFTEELVLDGSDTGVAVEGEVPPPICWAVSSGTELSSLSSFPSPP
jgi:hypothetical protein